MRKKLEDSTSESLKFSQKYFAAWNCSTAFLIGEVAVISRVEGNAAVI